MKKLLTILSTAPLALAACGAQPLDDIDMVEIGESSPIPSYSALSYGTTGGIRVFDGTYSFGSTQSYLRMVDTYWYSQNGQNLACDLHTGATSDRHVMLGSIFHNQKADLVGNDYIVDYNGYNFTFPIVPAWSDSSSDPTLCYATGGSIEVIPTVNTKVKTNLAQAVANLDKDLKVISTQINETNNSGSNYAWEDQYVSGTTNSYGFKLMDKVEFDTAILDSSIPISWRYTQGNVDDVWSNTMNAINLKFKGLTLEEAEKVTLGTGWVPEGMTGVDENLTNRTHYANVIVDAIREATALANA